MVAGGLERATRGTVEVAGRDLGPLDEDARARLRRDTIGIVFQGFHLIPTMTALENVGAAAGIRGPWRCLRPGARRRSRGSASGTASATIRRSSRAASSSAWRWPAPSSAGPALLLADEPTGNLDGTTGKQVMDLLFELARAEDTTLLLITHDMELAARCDRILRIADGVVGGR